MALYLPSAGFASLGNCGFFTIYALHLHVRRHFVMGAHMLSRCACICRERDGLVFVICLALSARLLRIPGGGCPDIGIMDGTRLSSSLFWKFVVAFVIPRYGFPAGFTHVACLSLT